MNTKGSIDVHGQLHIFRKRINKLEGCLCAKNPKYKCDDSCPLFGEVKKSDKIDGHVELQICEGRVLYFSKFHEFEDQEKFNCELKY